VLGVLSVIDGGTVRRFRPVDAPVRIDDVYVDPWVIR
jgi:hypothetical protein